VAKEITIAGLDFREGYIDDVGNVKENQLAPPSQNCRIDQGGSVYTRDGYADTGWDVNEGKPCMPFYMERYNITFLAVDDKVYYIDHNASDAVIDTGLTLTTGTTTRFTEHHGTIHLTNTTDGGRMIVVTRLNGAVLSAATSIVTDIDGGARANAFDTALSPSPKNLRISGTNVAYASVSGGTFTLSTTAGADYSDNTIAIITYSLASVAPKCEKFVVWKDCIHAIGISADEATVGTDIGPATLAFTKFAIATEIENSVTWSGGAAGTEMVGQSGILQNAIATRDFLYLLKSDECYYISVADVNQTTGGRPPQYLGPHGCRNPDCAVDMGNGEIVFLTPQNRIIRIKISTQTGAAVVYPDESFDVPIRKTLKKLATDQTGAFLYYHKAERLLFVQVKIESSYVTLVYDNNIGRWLPPDTNKVFKGAFEKDSILYATDLFDDTIYKLNETLYDDGQEIDWVFATGEFELEDGRRNCYWNTCEMSGGIAAATTIYWKALVGNQSTPVKEWNATGLTFSEGQAIGQQLIGDLIGGETSTQEKVNWEENKAIYPSLGSSCQIILSGVGGAARLDSYTIRATPIARSPLTLS
jgi:hypothetical protein